MATPFHLLIYTPQMWSYGGMERHLCLLAEKCRGEGMQVTLVTSSNSLAAEARARLLAAGVRFLELPAARGAASGPRKAFWLLQQALTLRRTQWDVIYTNGQSGLAPLLWIAARKGTRIIHHHHTAADLREQQSWSPLYRWCLRKAPELVACSRATKARMEAALDRREVRVLAYLTASVVPAESIRERAYHSDSVLHFGFVGRLVSTKGIEEICRLSDQPALQKIRWHLHGDGDAYSAESFKQHSYVTAHGAYKSPEEYARILTSLDALVLLSRHAEGLPLSLIEAMSAGLPWIATDRGGTQELAISSEDTLIIPADAEFERMLEMVTRFASQIRDGRTCRRRQRKAYETILEPGVVLRAWLELFTERPAA